MKTSTGSLMDVMSLVPVVLDEDATLDAALEMLSNYRFRHIPIVRNERVVGILSDRDLRLATSLMPAARRMRDSHGNALPGPKRVSEIMRHPVHCLAPDEPVERAARDMVAFRIGAIPVVEGQQLLGLVTETDLLRVFADSACGSAEDDQLARHHMRVPFPAVQSGTSLEDTLERMDACDRHLGVVDDGQLAGIVSERDLFQGLARATIRDTRAQADGRMEDVALKVASVMTREVFVVGPDATLVHCARALLRQRISALVVVEKGVPLGLLSQTAMLHAFAR